MAFVHNYHQVTLQHKKDFKTIDQIIKKLYSMVSMDIPVNRQVLLRNDNLCQYICGLISKEDFYYGVKNALECTISYKIAFAEGEKEVTVKITTDVEDSQVQELENRLQQINNALDRIKQGRYGFCLECGAEISQPRLEALPYASLCIDCASEFERRGF